MVTLVQFSKNMRRRGRQVENSATRVVKASAARTLRSLVNNTPVDKGVARSNWRIGLGIPTRAIIDAYAPGRNLGIGETANASAAIGAGLARINSVRGRAGVGLTTAIFITNATPYIQRLNAGYSKQAAAGFIERAVQEAQDEIRGFRVFTR